MKRVKDKYMINRTKYKDIKRYDHKQMEDFLTDVYKNGYADGKESVPGVELQDVEKALQDVKGIGPVVWNRIKERLAELFRKERIMKDMTYTPQTSTKTYLNTWIQRLACIICFLFAKTGMAEWEA